MRFTIRDSLSWRHHRKTDGSISRSDMRNHSRGCLWCWISQKRNEWVVKRGIMSDFLVWVLCAICFVAGWASRYLMDKECEEFAPTTNTPPPSLIPPALIE